MPASLLLILDMVLGMLVEDVVHNAAGPDAAHAKTCPLGSSSCPGRASVSGLTASLNMLVMTSSGFDFSGADCMTWMSEAGFKACRVVPLTAVLSMVVGAK